MITRRSALSLMVGAALTPLMRWPNHVLQDLTPPDPSKTWQRLNGMSDSEVFLRCRLATIVTKFSFERGDLSAPKPESVWVPPAVSIERIDGKIKSIRFREWNITETMIVAGCQLYAFGATWLKYQPGLMRVTGGDTINYTYSFNW